MEIQVAYGQAVKALGDGRVAGYLVTWGDPTTADGDREFFTPETDFATDFPTGSATYYHHGLDVKMGKRRIGRGELKADDVGVWIEAQLEMRDEYERAIYALAEAGKLGWSSGTAPHLVEKKAVRDEEGRAVAYQITHWPLGLDASLTPKPADPRNGAVALKTLAEIPSLEELSALESDAPPPVETTIKTICLDEAATAEFQVHSAAVASAAEEFAARAERRLEARIKAGRVLSAANVQEIEAVRDSLSALADRLAACLERAQPKPPSDMGAQKSDPPPSARIETERLRNEWLRLQSRVTPATAPA